MKNYDYCYNCAKKPGCDLCFTDPEDKGQLFKHFRKRHETLVATCCIISMIMCLAGAIELDANLRWPYAPYWFGVALAILIIGVTIHARK